MRKRPNPTRRKEKTGSAAPKTQTLPAWVEALRDARESKDLSFQAAAELVGVTRAFWHQVENGKRTPSPALAVLMAAVMDLSQELRDEAASESLREPFSSTDYQGVEAAILAAIASAGLQVEPSPRLDTPLNFATTTTRPDALVTFPDGTRAAIEIKVIK